MSQVPWTMRRQQPDIYKVIEAEGAPGREMQDVLNALAHDGYRIAAVLPSSVDTHSMIILELETFSLTAEGDQAISQSLSS